MSDTEQASTSYCTRRNLRARKERKLYSDEWALPDPDDDIEASMFSFNIADKLQSDKYARDHYIKRLLGPEFNLSYIQKHGFSYPVLFYDKSGLGLHIPNSSFSVKDVRTCVGSKRIVDVMDVYTQKNTEMTMKEWQKYYYSPQKEKLLNVISLEFSHTKLEHYVRRPKIVRQLDWVDCVWPKHLKEAQTETTNSMESMKYPKVQKYCLMSVKGCYTDFHIDFGGTSVWYHILKGEKVFWLIKPSKSNMMIYEQWVLSGKQGSIFFGDLVETCERIHLKEGNTFFIPSGWIHAVYTPKDSLVFGGNFLHSYAMETQLRTAMVEESTRVPPKFRYPFFTEVIWYVMERYVNRLIGNSYLRCEDGLIAANPATEYVHLTSMELKGLKAMIKYVKDLPPNKKSFPSMLRDSESPLLIRDLCKVIESHLDDDPVLAITGRAFLHLDKPQRKIKYEEPEVDETPRPPKIPRTGTAPRRRRTRCKMCQACKHRDCGECAFCLDMVKFGGPGKAKQTCVMRQCLQPMLPITAGCSICGLDGWGQEIILPMPKVPKPTPSTLMECSVCYEIVHPTCLSKSMPNADGTENEDLPNSWECPKCCIEGKNVEYKLSPERSSDSESESSSPIGRYNTSVSVSPEPMTSKNALKRQRPEGESGEHRSRKSMQNSNNNVRWAQDRNNKENGTTSSAALVPDSSKGKATSNLREQIATQLACNVIKPFKIPKLSQKPALPSQFLPSPVSDTTDLFVNPIALKHVFQWLTPSDLGKCSLVCKAWCNSSTEPVLWRTMVLSHKKITAACLTSIARRQPIRLYLDWTGVAKRQLEWLLARLPNLKLLSLQSCPVSSTSVLRLANCPPLTWLDLSFIVGLNDSVLRDILTSPEANIPSTDKNRSKLKGLQTLKLAGCDISDVGIRYIVQYLNNLVHLDVSQCFRVTNNGVSQLCTPPACTVTTLMKLDLSACQNITDDALDLLRRCKAIKTVDLSHIQGITNEAIDKFIARRPNLIANDKLITERNP